MCSDAGRCTISSSAAFDCRAGSGFFGLITELLDYIKILFSNLLAGRFRLVKKLLGILGGLLLTIGLQFWMLRRRRTWF